MSCFKKDGTLKKVYMSLVPLIENAEPHHGIVSIGKSENPYYEYDSLRFKVPKDREKYITALLDELEVSYKIWHDLTKNITIDVLKNDEVLDIVRQAD